MATAAVVATLTLAVGGCASSDPQPGGSAGYGDLAATALVTPQDVETIAGQGFAPYESQTTASATDPTECLELLRFADGTRTAPPATASSATVSYARGSTGESITNTVHVMADTTSATVVYDRLVGLAARCRTFTAVVGPAVLQAQIATVPLPAAGERSFGLRVTITSPTQKSDVTSALSQQGRTLVVAVAGTQDGADEDAWAAKTASVSAEKAVSMS